MTNQMKVLAATAVEKLITLRPLLRDIRRKENLGIKIEGFGPLKFLLDAVDFVSERSMHTSCQKKK